MGLIDKEAIKKFIADGLNSGEFGHDAVQILAEIEYMPTVDAEPVRHGRWIPVDGEMPCDEWDCSVCEERMTFMLEMDEDDMKENYSYCPHCGAKMDEEV